MAHSNPHAQAHQTVTIDRKGIEGEETFRLEDWWDRVAGQSWMDSDGNPAALHYAMRAGLNGLPTDDEVVYGKVGSFGHLVHVSEILPTSAPA
jgi:hypothetical protein